jgi:hypothetical protein
MREAVEPGDFDQVISVESAALPTESCPGYSTVLVSGRTDRLNQAAELKI